MNFESDSTVVIFNGQAGGGHDCPPELADRGWRILPTQDAAEARDFALRAAECGVETVLSAGGDGTLHAVVNGLGAAYDKGYTQLPALGVLPMGTANDFCRSLGLSQDLGETLAMLASQNQRPIDIGTIQFPDRKSYFINVASGGFVPELAKIADQERKRFWGKLTYFRGGVEALSSSKSYKINLSCDDQQFSLPVWNFVVANGRYAGGGVDVAPHANLADGKLNVTIFHGDDLTEFLKSGLEYFWDRTDSQDLVKILECEKFSIAGDQTMPLSADGEPVGEGRVTFSTIPAALQVYCGKEGAAAEWSFGR